MLARTLAAISLIVLIGCDKPQTPVPVATPTPASSLTLPPATTVKATPPAQDPPVQPPAVQERSIVEPIEELVYELEDMLEGQRVALTQFAFDQAMGVYDDTFEGDVFYDATPWKLDLTQQHFTISVRKAGEKTPARPDLRGLLTQFMSAFDRIDFVTFKFDGADYGATKDEATGLMKVTFTARKNGVPVEVFERSKAKFRKVGGQWKIASLARETSKRKDGRNAVFVDVTRAAGLWCESAQDCHGCAYMMPVADCGGIAAGDYDNDGDIDLYITRVGPPLLYANDGDGTFIDVAMKAGLTQSSKGAGAIWMDYDNDGWLDLITTAICEARDVCRGCAVKLHRNLGNGTLKDVTVEVLGGAFRGAPHSICAADVNKDGLLDFFVTMYGQGLARTLVGARDGEPDLLFINKGGRKFEECAAKAGVAEMGWGYACIFFDYDDDTWPDLYVVNDFGTHVLFRNKGDGTFEDCTAKAGLQHLGFGMGVSVGDVERRGLLDIYVSNMYSTAGNRILSRSDDISAELKNKLLQLAQGNSLLRNNGDGTFKEVAVERGCNKGGWAWGNVFIDYDDNGWPDIFVANGYMSGRSRKDT